MSQSDSPVPFPLNVACPICGANIGEKCPLRSVEDFDGLRARPSMIAHFARYRAAGGDLR